MPPFSILRNNICFRYTVAVWHLLRTAKSNEAFETNQKRLR